MPKTKKINQSKVVKELTSRLLNRVTNDWIVSIVLYGSTTNNTYISENSNIDLMIVVKTPRHQIDLNKLKLIYKIHEKYVEEFKVPIDIYTYGYDELPRKKNFGYSLLRSLFIYDYFKHARVIYGKNILKELIHPHIKTVSLQLVNELKRGVRQMIYDSKYMSKPGVIKRMIGDRAGNTVQVTTDIAKGLDDHLRWACVSLIFSQKARLAYDGILVSGKNRIFKKYLEEYKQNDSSIKHLYEIYNWWVNHISKEYERWGFRKQTEIISLDEDKTRKMIIICLRHIEHISNILEEKYNG
ncbi:MAG: hypothetical protein ACD_57C00221G0006 [uncultured bacterium]|uniref:Polymerase nucleotidyl transferase domain-containing protein n=1 Tax=Candidatus Woesebacteria bacterium RIFCSPLOWO2_01_FULL_39_21 TaxID=1802519 RepID=A0A1F8BDQ2_9BACT|nr:MAG: hypothetical protein ACD_57C00221G0006 [uncultured bacterium]OGM22078.1 MAG: hypothetical protein A2691_03265 [Candidatus Woesebacteria bacterium RIFCSPHIGHO2_01_FULL_39_23]OGM62080.1 MAG: hypothetical protein A2961_04890 [Candidatus Woesebacteria bacterium RIFCSPLOWO2_01_FULL_39_21]